VKFVWHENGTVLHGTAAAARRSQTVSPIDTSIVEQPYRFSIAHFRCVPHHNGYNLSHKGGSMAKDKSPKKEVKKPKKKK
jgi:hypothetical protein